MGHELVTWVRSLPRHTRHEPTGLTPAERDIFTVICDRVDPRQGSYWWDRPSEFIAKHAPFIPSEQALRNHIASLRHKGYMETVHRGGGPKARNTRKSRTHYKILHPAHIAPAIFEQFKLPLLTLIKNHDAFHGKFRSSGKSEFSGESEPKLASISGESEPKLASISGESEPKLASISGESEPKLASISGESDAASLYNRIHVTEGPTVSQTASTASDHSDLETLCAVASEIDISGLLPEDIRDIKPALHEYRGLQRRRPLEEVARRIANQVKRNIPDNIRSDHLRIVRYFSKVASELLRRGGGVSVAGTRRDPGKLHPETTAASENEEWRERYERNRAWHDERIKAQGG